jgi:putative intracellular protease/amidase
MRANQLCLALGLTLLPGPLAFRATGRLPAAVRRSSGCAMSEGAAQQRPLVVIGLTSNDQYPNGDPTGWYLPEAVDPYNTFTKAGFDVLFASIKGGVAPCDPKSVREASETSLAFWEDPELRALTERTIPLWSVDPAACDALFFAGGFGVMWDFPDDPGLQALTRDVYEAAKPVGGVCHGPIALINVQLHDGSYLVDGKEVTAFTNGEEDEVGKYEVVTRTGPGSCQDMLTARGGRFKDGGIWATNVCVAGNLMTGQNPASATPLAEAMVEAVNKRMGN